MNQGGACPEQGGQSSAEEARSDASPCTGSLLLEAQQRAEQLSKELALEISRSEQVSFSHAHATGGLKLARCCAVEGDTHVKACASFGGLALTSSHKSIQDMHADLKVTPVMA